MNKSQVSKILSDLRESGFLSQDSNTREYSVGLRAVALAGQYLKSNELPREALGPMRKLSESTGQTATLYVMDHFDIMYVASIEGPLFVGTTWQMGTFLPFHATAAGKLFVAFLPDAEVDRFVTVKGLTRFTSATICEPQKLKRELRQIRKQGVSIALGEFTIGLDASAVPIFGGGEKIVGSLGLVYPSHVVSAKQRGTFTKELHDAARFVSLRLGASVYPFGALTASR